MTPRLSSSVPTLRPPGGSSSHPAVQVTHVGDAHLAQDIGQGLVIPQVDQQERMNRLTGIG